MKLKLTALIASVAIAGLAAVSAQAGTISVGGVLLNPDSQLDFFAVSGSLQQTINSINGVTSGLGVVTTLNGTDVSSFCPTCELTFQYGGFTPMISGKKPTGNGAIDYTDGWLRFYIDTTKDANASDPMSLTAVNTGNGTLWLSLVAHADSNGVTYISSVTGDTKKKMTGAGQFDVVGGAAAAYFNTNSMDYGSDLAFSPSFTKFVNNSLLFETGSGNFAGDAVPEPGSLALLGLGLLGLVSSRRGRKNS